MSYYMQIIEITNSNFDKNKITELLSKKICFIGVFSKMCIHCQNMKSQWQYLKSKLKKSNCNGILLEIDAEQLNYIDYSSLSNSIKGFPSIMIFKNGKLKKDYKGDRTTNDMFKFFKPYMVLIDKSPHMRLKNKSFKKTKKNRRIKIKKISRKR